MKNTVLILDQSGSMAPPKRGQPSVLSSFEPAGVRVARRIHNRKEPLVMLRFGRRVTTQISPSVDDVSKAFRAHVAYRDSNLKLALQKAEKLGSKRVYLFTDGKPNFPAKVLEQLEQMTGHGTCIVVIAPPSKGKEEPFLKQAAAVPGVKVLHLKPE